VLSTAASCWATTVARHQRSSTTSGPPGSRTSWSSRGRVRAGQGSRLGCPTMADDRPIRALIYTRVSSDRSGDRRSPAEQEAELRALAEAHGWEVIGAETDGGVGASR